MTRTTPAWGAAVALCVGAAYYQSPLSGQSPAETVEMHVAAAKAAAGDAQVPLLALCNAPEPRPAAAGRASQPPARPNPPRAEWQTAPVQVFDNLYYVGEKEYSAWAVTTSAGIIIVDAIYDYSVEDQIVGGLKKLGFDPNTIKYVVVSHAHRDHAGGAWYLQERFGARVVLSAADWDMLEHTGGAWPKARRDIVAADGQQLTLGDTTLTFHATPGHTPGTISTLIPVRDKGQAHVALLWGGTGFNFTTSPGRPRDFWFASYIRSAERMRGIVAASGADVFLSNHPSWDGSKAKMAALTRRQPGEPHPYVVGNATLQRFLTVAEECARAGRLREGGV